MSSVACGEEEESKEVKRRKVQRETQNKGMEGGV
jgi:hypothetical protein